jgi:hypothetical protein
MTPVLKRRAAWCSEATTIRKSELHNDGVNKDDIHTLNVQTFKLLTQT